MSNKLYAFENLLEASFIISKGVKADSLSIKDFQDLYENSQNIYAERVEVLTSYQKSSVITLNRKVGLNFDSYTKREKLLSDNM